MKSKSTFSWVKALQFAGGFTIINGIGNYFFKDPNLNYLLYMLVLGTALIAVPYYYTKGKK